MRLHASHDAQIRFPKIDKRKLDRDTLRGLFRQSDSSSGLSYDWEESSESESRSFSVDARDRINALNIANRNLCGEIPSALGDMASLEQLHATSNHFTGKSVMCGIISTADENDRRVS